MQDFDTALLNLWKDGKIDIDEALKNADSPNNLKLKVKLSGEEGTGPAEKPGGGMNLSLEKTEEEIAAEKKAAQEEKELQEAMAAMEAQQAGASEQQAETETDSGNQGGESGLKLE
jgi:hypothetical protein